MILTPEEVKVVKDFLVPAVKNGLLDADHLKALLQLAASDGENKPEAPEKLYTVREAADLLGRHPKTIHRDIRLGRLACIKIGPRSPRISETALKQFVSDQSAALITNI